MHRHLAPVQKNRVTRWQPPHRRRLNAPVQPHPWQLPRYSRTLKSSTRWRRSSPPQLEHFAGGRLFKPAGFTCAGLRWMKASPLLHGPPSTLHHPHVDDWLHLRLSISTRRRRMESSTKPFMLTYPSSLCPEITHLICYTISSES